VGRAERRRLDRTPGAFVRVARHRLTAERRVVASFRRSNHDKSTFDRRRRIETA
jgi:hypothetical protein